MRRNLFVASVVVAASILVLSHVRAADQRDETRLIGTIGDVAAPEAVWVGAIEVRLRSPFVLKEQRDAALAFMRALAFKGREVECRLTGERTPPHQGGALVGDCVVFGPEDRREIDLGGRLIERGFARACKEPVATIAIWPPVLDCQ